MASSEDGPFEAFRRQLEQCTRTSRFHEPEIDFILASRLLDWLREPSENARWSRAYALLLWLYDRREPSPGVFRDLGRDSGRHQKKCWLKVFVILLQMSSDGSFAKYIHIFYDNQIWDSTLPELFGTPDKLLRVIQKTQYYHADEWDTAVEYFLFLARQLCTREAITRDHQRDLGPHNILPITAKDPVNSGGQSNVFRIEVPLECLSDDLAQALGDAEVDEDQSKYYLLALKKIAYEGDWKREITFHRALWDTEGIVQCLGSWSVQVGSTTEYYLLLEFGWSDLGQYFESTPAPSLPEDISNFWRSFLSITIALDKIHNLEISGGGLNITYVGWHGDIKPSNILLCGNEQSGNQIKLTDPGFATIVLLDEASMDEQRLPVVRLTGGTIDYGGPERTDPQTGQLDTRRPVTQRFDIWSFACVLYEAATWVILGPRGIEQFKLVRKMNRNEDFTEEPHGSAAFHNNGNLSSAVHDWHDYLLRSLRGGDRISGSILTIAREKLLLADPHQRKSSADLVRLVDGALQSCEKEMSKLPRYDFPVYFDAAFAWESRVAERTWQDSSAGARSTRAFRSVRFAQPRRQFREGEVDYSSRSLPYQPTRSDEQVSVVMPMATAADFSPVGKRASQALTVPSQHDISQKEPIFGYYNALDLLLQRGWTYSSRLGLRDSPPPGEGPPKSRTWGLSSRKTLTPRTPDDKTQNGAYSSALSQAWHKLRPQKGTHKSLQPSAQSRAHPIVQSQTHDVYGELFTDRDIIFLADNHDSMEPHWSQVQDILSLLMAMLYGQDKDGSDLYFSSSRDRYKSLHEPFQIEELMKKYNPRERKHATRARSFLSSIPGPTGIESQEGIHMVLDTILHNVKAKQPYTGKVTIIILTNALWDEDQQKVLRTLIGSTLQVMTVSNRGTQLEDRDYSIQFILFGDDERAKGHLEYMDDELPDEFKVPDVIDYEPAGGDIMKMIMGSLDDRWDGKESARVEKTTSRPGVAEDLAPVFESSMDLQEPVDSQLPPRSDRASTGSSIWQRPQHQGPERHSYPKPVQRIGTSGSASTAPRQLQPRQPRRPFPF